MTEYRYATHSPETVQTTAPRRRKVDHLFWVPDMEFAAAVGVDMRSLCGVWDSPAPPVDEVPVIGGLVPIFDRRDCLRCARVYAAALRSDFDKRRC